MEKTSITISDIFLSELSSTLHRNHASTLNLFPLEIVLPVLTKANLDNVFNSLKDARRKYKSTLLYDKFTTLFIQPFITAQEYTMGGSPKSPGTVEQHEIRKEQTRVMKEDKDRRDKRNKQILPGVRPIKYAHAMEKNIMMYTITCPLCGKAGKVQDHALRTASALKCPACHKTAKLNTSLILAHCMGKEFDAIRKKLKHTREFSDADVKKILKRLEVIQQKYHDLEKSQPEEKEAIRGNPPTLYQKADPRGLRNPLSLLGNLGRQKLREALMDYNNKNKSAEALQVAEALDNLAQSEFVQAKELATSKQTILDKARVLPAGFAEAISTALSTTRENAPENMRNIQAILYKQQHGSDVGVMTPELMQRREQDTQVQRKKWLEEQSKRLQDFITTHPGPAEHAPALKMASMLLKRALELF